MLIAAVVEDHIHHHLQPFLMGFVAEALVVLVAAKSGIHLVIVRGGIAVIGREAVLLIRRVILQDGGQPEGRHTELLEIVQMLADAVQIATVTQ